MPISRRKALLFSLGGGAALGLGTLTAIRRSRSDSDPGQWVPVSRSSWALGSDVSMTVAGLPRPAAERALDAAFAELETVEQVMSLYRPDSQICRLNRTGELRDPHPFLLEVLRHAEATSRRTFGAFDITVQPLWELYSAAKRQGRLPTDDELAVARAKVGWWGVESCWESVVRLGGAGQQITLNGVAQGFAADRAVAALKRHGVEHALVNAGEIGAHGSKPTGEPWTIGIQHPREADSFVSLAGLADRSLSTSGDYETSFTDDFRKHHIFDPRTGDSPPELASVSIVAPTALEADALSTAAMVLGVERTLQLVARSPGVDALLVTKSGRTIASAGFPEYSTT
jgi:thiamine biosynthesis lipoprotein